MKTNGEAVIMDILNSRMAFGCQKRIKFGCRLLTKIADDDRASHQLFFGKPRIFLNDQRHEHPTWSAFRQDLGQLNFRIDRQSLPQNFKLLDSVASVRFLTLQLYLATGSLNFHRSNTYLWLRNIPTPSMSSQDPYAVSVVVVVGYDHSSLHGDEMMRKEK
ncbi:unnamed protein product [Soboliphyme baturini]|uniref:Fe2OG dioxygenase domain-containing protein n=1 Tax=Soboliphyme baturini TaxID=241478 RepID=A0A183ID54_9BILA|nr:unnamed protein product [Soboliphyme baturini]